MLALPCVIYARDWRERRDSQFEAPRRRMLDIKLFPVSSLPPFSQVSLKDS